MDGQGIKEIISNVPKPTTITVGGIEHAHIPDSQGGWRDAAVGPDNQPAAVGLYTLSGLVDYVKANRDALALAECVLHVKSHAAVSLVGKLGGAPYFRRPTFVVAAFEELLGKSFGFGTYYDPETFNVALQTLFVDTPERAQVLSIIGNLKQEQVRTAEDDGTTQTVELKAGVVLGYSVKVPNPVSLKPYRTFREIDQPASNFVLRLRGGAEGRLPEGSLFEADGGAWKLTAIAAIREYLAAKLADAITIVA